MTWIGTWRNQYGSTVTITGEADGKLKGAFRTALETSPVFGEDCSIEGVCLGDLISFVAAGGEGASAMVVSYTGKLADGRMETLWHLAKSRTQDRALSWWESMMIGADTFERVD